MTKPLVIYHGNCQDGFTAAWVMHGWFEAHGHKAEYFAAHYAPEGERVELPEVVGREVYMVDFSTGRDQLIDINADAKSFVVLDHHKTAQAACEGLEFCEFDMDRSGAMLAWDFCWRGRPAPWIVQYAQDRDLWRWALPRSREVNAFLASQELTLESWSRIGNGAMTWVEAADRGRGALDFVDNYVRSQQQRARRGTFAGHPDIPVINTTTAISELVGALAETAAFAVGWFEREDGKLIYSLRSRGDFDVSAVAKQFGGGGHKNAAGFTVAERVHP